MRSIILLLQVSTRFTPTPMLNGSKRAPVDSDSVVIGASEVASSSSHSMPAERYTRLKQTYLTTAGLLSFQSQRFAVPMERSGDCTTLKAVASVFSVWVLFMQARKFAVSREHLRIMMLSPESFCREESTRRSGNGLDSAPPTSSVNYKRHPMQLSSETSV
jgi:hypothetical protein